MPVKKEKRSVIRTIYLYLFTLIGLSLITIGTVRIVDMALKAFIFTEAEQEEQFYRQQPPVITKSLLDTNTSGEEVTLTIEEKEELDRIITEYQNWENQNQQVDFIRSRRHRDAASSLAQILIGLPLYLYHWFLIKRETKEA